MLFSFCLALWRDKSTVHLGKRVSEQMSKKKFFGGKGLGKYTGGESMTSCKRANKKGRLKKKKKKKKEIEEKQRTCHFASLEGVRRSNLLPGCPMGTRWLGQNLFHLQHHRRLRSPLYTLQNFYIRRLISTTLLREKALYEALFQ